MIYWCAHTEPYTENPSENRKQPEGFFWYSPPIIDRFEFVYPHDDIREEVDDEEKI